MRSSFTIVFMFLVTFAGKAQQFEKIFVDPGWLYSRLRNDSIIILHLDKPQNYNKGHIPGSLFLEPDNYTATREGLYYEMPDSSDFEELLKKRGIDNTKKVIISSGWETFAHAFRLYVTFEYFGLADQVRILDGGIRGWQFKGYPVSKDTSIATATDITLSLKLNKNMLPDKEWVRSNLTNPEICFMDARRDRFYSGVEKGNYRRSGHIKGAKNLTWTTLVDENFFLLKPESLRQMFEEIAEDPNRILVMYCHVGLRASVLYTVGKALGYHVRLYDGSYNEWDGLDATYPVESE